MLATSKRFLVSVCICVFFYFKIIFRMFRFELSSDPIVMFEVVQQFKGVFKFLWVFHN